VFQKQPLVIPKPGLSARNLFAASESADFSRSNAAFRNDNSFGDFEITALRGLGQRKL
jgi:hypothetical protein